MLASSPPNALRRIRSTGLLALALAPLLAAVLLPSPGAQGVTEWESTLSVVDSFLVLVPVRNVDEIRRDQESARRAEAEAGEAMNRAQSLQERARAHIKVKKKELEAVDARRELARKEKDRDAERAADSRRAHGRRELELLERREELREAEIDAARAARALASAQLTAGERELDLALRREAQGGGRDRNVSESERGRLDREIRELENRTLAALEEVAAKRQEAARREVGLARSKRRLFESQLALWQGRI